MVAVSLLPSCSAATFLTQGAPFESSTAAAKSSHLEADQNVATQNTVRSAAEVTEISLTLRRGQPRAPVQGNAAYLSHSRILIARSADVSLTGAFVGTQHPDPLGTLAALRLERNKEFIVADVEVVRVSLCSLPDGSGLGMGLKFCNLTKAQRRFLARYVAARHTEG